MTLYCVFTESERFCECILFPSLLSISASRTWSVWPFKYSAPSFCPVLDKLAILCYTMPLPTHFTLNTGAQIPAVGFGTWQAAPHEVERAVETALREGYRHIDCAAIYRNETEVGQGIKNSGVSREEIFLTSKLWNTKHAPEDVEAALDKTLNDLGVAYLDLYLMHWPVYVLELFEKILQILTKTAPSLEERNGSL